MTIAFDSSSSTVRSAITSSVISWKHTPSGTPKGVVVAICEQTTISSYGTWTSAVSYGTVAMSRIVRGFDSSAEKGSGDLWFLGSGVPTSAQTVMVTVDSSTTARFLCAAMAVTAAGDTELVDSDFINGDTTDPVLTLQNSARTCMSFAALYSGHPDPGDFTANGNTTVVVSADFGAQCGLILRSGVGTSDTTIGGTLSLDDVGYAAMSVGEVATAFSTGTVGHVESSGFTLGNETTGGKIVIPVSAVSGDLLICGITSRNHDSGTARPTCTDNDLTGNAWALLAETEMHKGTIYTKSATSDSAGKTVTIAGAVNSCAAGISAYRFQNQNNTISNLNISSVKTLNPSFTGFTPDSANAMICMSIFDVADDSAVTNVVATSPASLVTRLNILSAGGVNCTYAHASSGQTLGLSGTGNFSYTRSNHSNYAIYFAISSSTSTLPSSSTTVNSGTTQNPVHVYASAGTYVVSLIVTDNDGNNSSASTRNVHVS